MNRSRKFARFSEVRIVAQRGAHARLFGEFGTVVGQENEEKSKLAYWVDIYRSELFFAAPGSMSEEVERKLFQPNELHATREVDGFYSKSDPVVAARRDLARAIERRQLYVCLLVYLYQRCPPRNYGIHPSENRLVEGLPKRWLTDLSKSLSIPDRSWSYVMAFNRGLVRHLAANAPRGSWQHGLLRHFRRKPTHDFSKPSGRSNPKLSRLMDSLQYGELALAAAREFAKCGLDGLEAMISASANPDPFVRDAIISTVRQNASALREVAEGSQAEQTKKALVRMLVDRLQDEHWDIRSGAVGALHEFKAEPELVVPALIKLLRDPQCSYSAVSALSSYGTNAKHALDSLREHYKTAPESERPITEYAIKQIENDHRDAE